MMIAETIPLDHTEVLIEDDDSRHNPTGPHRSSYYKKMMIAGTIPLDHTEVLIEDDDHRHNPTGPHRSSYRR